MVKFSISRDEDEDDQEDFSIRSPKRRRTTLHFQPSDHHHHHQPSDGNNNDYNESSEEPTKSGSIPVILSDPDVLDCPICFVPLTLPVFQCDNGHIACTCCCSKLQHKCPSCCGPIGYNRCRAIEKVIESVRAPCCYTKYGCTKTISYCEKHAHEEICTYAPCSCPFPDCSYRCSPMKLSLHMTQTHADYVTRFHYNAFFTVSVALDDEFLVLLEERDGILFILSHRNTVSVKCIDPLLSMRSFDYCLVLHKGRSSLRFQAVTDGTDMVDSSPVDYFLVPGYFCDSGGCLKLEICIWDKEQSQADISQTVQLSGGLNSEG